MWKIEISKANQIDVELSGALDAIGMSLLLDEFLQTSNDMQHGNMLYTIADFEMPSAGAFAVEIKYIPRLFSLFSKIDKVALCCDANWIKTAAKIESALLPGITIKTFNLDEKAAAQEYLDNATD